MKRDTTFWVMVVIFVLVGACLRLSDWKFTAGNTFAHPRFQDEVLARQTEVPEIVRKFAGYKSEQKTEFLELRVGQYVNSSTGAVYALAFVAFVILATRQHRLAQRLERIETELAST